VHRLGKLELQAVVFETLDLLVVAVVGNADNGHARVLDDLLAGAACAVSVGYAVSHMRYAVSALCACGHVEREDTT